jgi:hypothetical protein
VAAQSRPVKHSRRGFHECLGAQPEGRRRHDPGVTESTKLLSGAVAGTGRSLQAASAKTLESFRTLRARPFACLAVLMPARQAIRLRSQDRQLQPSVPCRCYCCTKSAGVTRGLQTVSSAFFSPPLTTFDREPPYRLSEGRDDMMRPPAWILLTIVGLFVASTHAHGQDDTAGALRKEAVASGVLMQPLGDLRGSIETATRGWRCQSQRARKDGAARLFAAAGSLYVGRVPRRRARRRPRMGRRDHTRPRC